MMRIVLDNTDNAPRATTPPASPSQQGRRKTMAILDPTHGQALPHAQIRRGSVQAQKDKEKDRETSIERTSTRSSHSHNHSHCSLPSVAVPAMGAGTSAGAGTGAGAHAVGVGHGRDRESAKHGTPSARHALPKSLLHATGNGGSD